MDWILLCTWGSAESAGSVRCPRSCLSLHLGKFKSQTNSSEEKERVMAAVCEVCKKHPSWGMSVSHSHVRTKRRWSPNIQRVRAMINGTPKRLYVCTSCIRAGKVTKVSRGTAASDK